MKNAELDAIARGHRDDHCENCGNAETYVSPQASGEVVIRCAACHFEIDNVAVDTLEAAVRY